MDLIAELPQIVLLAGGQGTRLRNSFPHRPKALVPFGDRPFMYHLLTRLRREGVGRIILALGFGADEIREDVESYAIPSVEFVIEKIPRGTGGAIADIVKSRNLRSPFLIANADTWWEAPLGDFLSRPVSEECEGLLACVKSFGENRYTTLEEGLTFSGLAWLRPEIFAEIGADRPCRLEEVWNIKKLERHVLPGRFYDFGTAEGLKEFASYFERGCVNETF